MSVHGRVNLTSRNFELSSRLGARQRLPGPGTLPAVLSASPYSRADGVPRQRRKANDHARHLQVDDFAALRRPFGLIAKSCCYVRKRANVVQSTDLGALRYQRWGPGRARLISGQSATT